LEIIIPMSAMKLADIWLKARIAGINLNEAIVCEFKEEIMKQYPSASKVIPKIGLLGSKVYKSRIVYETIVGADLEEFIVSSDSCKKYARVLRTEWTTEFKKSGVE